MSAMEENQGFISDKEKSIGGPEVQNKDNTKGKCVSPAKEKLQPKCKYLVGLLTLVAVVELTVLLVVTVRWRDVRNAAMARKEQRLCLPQSQIEDCSGELENGEESCCGEASRLIDVLIEQYSRKKFEDTASARMLTGRCAQNTPDTTTVVMMSGLSMQRIQQQGEGTVVFWNETSPRTIFKGFRYKDGSIFINKTGHYYIYSQIKVTKTPKQQSGQAFPMASDRPFFSHQLHRHSRLTVPRRQVLLESSNSDCDIASDNDEMSSSFGAVFELKAGDKIYVETSHPQHLVDCLESNFFGLYSV